MRVLLFILLSLSFITVSAQGVFDEENRSYVNIGIDVFGDSIAADHFNLKEFMIKTYRYDSVSKRLYLFLRKTKNNFWVGNKEYMVCYNIASGKVVFADEFFGGSSRTILTKSRLIRNEEGRSVVYDLEDGVVLWDNKGYNTWAKREVVFYVNEESQVFVTSSGRLIDLKKGELVTKNTFDEDMGGIFMDVLGKDSLLMINEGLKFLQTKTSDSWQLDMKMGMDKYHSLKNFDFQYRSLHALDFRMSQRNTLRILGMHSELLEDGADLIIASRDEIARVARNGDVLWKSKLPNDTTGKSDLYLKGDTVFVLNRGYGYCTGYKDIGAKYVKTAAPYLAAYDKNKGRLLYRKVLKEEPAMCVSSIEEDGILYVLLIDTLMSVRLSTGEVIKTMVLEDDLSDVWSFARKSIMYQDNEDGTYTYVPDKYPGCIAMLDDAPNIYIINKELDIIEFAKGSKYYFKKDAAPYHYMMSSSKTLIYRGDKILSILADEKTPDIIDAGKAILLTRNGITILDLQKPH